MKLVTPEQMREMDRRTIQEVGLPGPLLMERAAMGGVDVLLRLLTTSGKAAQPAHSGARVGILCGPGNNGGDGLAMARLLAARGLLPTIFLLGAPASMTPDAALNLQIARNLDLDIRDLSSEPDDQIPRRLTAWAEQTPGAPPPTAWCDAMLGTGVTRAIEGRYRAAIECVDTLRTRLHTPVLAVDIPTGIDAHTAKILGCALRADATATFGYAKLGQTQYPGRAFCGELEVIDIGIPTSVADQVGFAAEWLDEAWAQEHSTRRPRDYHKGKSGRLLLLAGSHEKAGAAFLAARGALHSGAGLLTVGTHEEVVARVATALPEAMAAHMLADVPDGALYERLAEQVDQFDAVGMGPGVGTSDGTLQQLQVLLESETPFLVLDADALTVLANFDDYEMLRDAATRHPDRPTRVVLTPHPGEMARLCHCNTDEVTAAPTQKAQQLARETQCIVVLKTATTVIAHPDGRLAINRSGNPGMATGGVGDVLTGVIAARLAEAHAAGARSVFELVCLSVFAHGAAGDRAAQKLGERGMGASDLAAQLAAVWSALES